MSATSGGISNISFTSVITSVIVIPAGIASASFTFLFSLATEIIKKLLKVTRKKKKKHNKIVMLAKSKLNSIETKLKSIEIKRYLLIDLEINHEEFKTIINEKNI